MTNLKMMGLGPGHLVHTLFHFMTILLVVSVAQIPLVVSVSQILLVVWAEYFLLVVWVDEILMVVWVEHSQLVESQNYFPAQKLWWFQIQIFLNIVAERFRLANSPHRNFLATMTIYEQVGFIR